MADNADPIQSFESEFNDKSLEINDDSNILNEEEGEENKSNNPSDKGKKETDESDNIISNEVDQSDLTEFFDDLGQIEKRKPVLDEQQKTVEKNDSIIGKKSGFFSLLNLLNLFRFKKNKQPTLKRRKKLSFIPLLIIFILLIGGYIIYSNMDKMSSFFNSGVSKVKEYYSSLTTSDEFVEPEFVEEDKILIQSDYQSTNMFDNFNINPSGKWLVQVAACFESKCRNSTKRLLANRSIPTRFITENLSVYNAKFIKLYGVDTYQYKNDATEVMNKINHNNSYGVVSYLEPNTSGYTLVMGYFPSETYGISGIISNLRQEINEIYPEMLLNINYESGQSNIYQVTVGPFVRRNTAQEFLDLLQSKPGFQKSIIIKK